MVATIFRVAALSRSTRFRWKRLRNFSDLSRRTDRPLFLARKRRRHYTTAAWGEWVEIHLATDCGNILLWAEYSSALCCDRCAIFDHSAWALENASKRSQTQPVQRREDIISFLWGVTWRLWNRGSAVLIDSRAKRERVR